MGLDMVLKIKSKDGCVDALVWRKANQIHGFFSRLKGNDYYLDSCEVVNVKKSDLENLLVLCEKIKTDFNLAKELLPTVQGFFFGDYDYNDNYNEDIDNTIVMLKELFERENIENSEFQYLAWY